MIFMLLNSHLGAVGPPHPHDERRGEVAVDRAVRHAEADVQGVGEEEGSADGGHGLPADAVRHVDREVEQEVAAVDTEKAEDVPQVDLPLHFAPKLEEQLIHTKKRNEYPLPLHVSSYALRTL